MQLSPQIEEEVYWSTHADCEFHWENWGEQYALFDGLSGETHLLPELAACILRELEKRECTASELAVAVCEQINTACDQDSIVHIARLLQQLKGAGLVEKSLP